MKKIIIIHCWDGYPKYCWYPQTKRELEAKGFQVEVPIMPETNSPKLSFWLPKLKEVISDPNKDLFLVGHSVGVITILRYLEQLEKSKAVGGVVMVAGFTDSLGYSELENFFSKPIDFEIIKQRSNFFVAIHSDDDPYVALNYGKEFKEKLGAKLISKHSMGHFSGSIDNENSCTDLPEVTQTILNMSKKLGVEDKRSPNVYQYPKKQKETG